jgi:hypothetical protein
MGLKYKTHLAAVYSPFNMLKRYRQFSYSPMSLHRPGGEASGTRTQRRLSGRCQKDALEPIQRSITLVSIDNYCELDDSPCFWVSCINCPAFKHKMSSVDCSSCFISYLKCGLCPGRTNLHRTLFGSRFQVVWKK